jgi:hypothetical protein
MMTAFRCLQGKGGHSPGGSPHRRQPVTSRTHRFAYVPKEWPSCMGQKRRAHYAALRSSGRESICTLPPGTSCRLGRTAAGPRRLPLARAAAVSSGAPPGALSVWRSRPILTRGGRHADASHGEEHRARRLDAVAAVCAVAPRTGQKAAPAGGTADGAPAPPRPRGCWDHGAAPRRNQQR